MVQNPAPEVTITGVTLFLGSRRIEVNYTQGTRRGFVFHPTRDCLCGDLFWRHTLPNLVDATTSAWISTLRVHGTK
jgi:hypothetical protein